MKPKTPFLSLFLCLIILVSIIIPPLAIGSPGWLDGWAKRVNITLDQNDIDAALANFPVLLYLSTSSGRGPDDISFIFDEVGANSLQIAVTTSDGVTECYVEVEKWDLGNEEAWLWVKVPSIASGADTDIYLYYDNDQADNDDYVGITNSVVAENVWDANFKLVSHLRDDPDNTAVRDSTNHDLDGTKKNAGEPAITANGKIDGAQEFDGNNDYIDFVGAFTAIRNDDTFTIETWSYLDALPGQWAFYWSAADYGGRLYLATSSVGKLRLLRDITGWQDETGTSTQAGTWQHIVIAFSDGTTGKLYVDGAFVEDLTVAAQHDVADDIRLGEYDDGNLAKWAWDGKIDEFRISSNTRAASWIKATYETGEDDLLDWGEEETSVAEYSREATQAIGIGLDTSRLAEFYRTAAQSISAGLSTSRLAEFYRATTQTINVVTGAARLSAFVRTASQAIGTGFTTDRLREVYRTASQAIGVALEPSRLIEFYRTATQSIDMALESSRLAGFYRTAAQSISVLMTTTENLIAERLASLALLIRSEITGLIPAEPPVEPEIKYIGGGITGIIMFLACIIIPIVAMVMKK